MWGHWTGLASRIRWRVVCPDLAAGRVCVCVCVCVACKRLGVTSFVRYTSTKWRPQPAVTLSDGRRRTSLRKSSRIAFFHGIIYPTSLSRRTPLCRFCRQQPREVCASWSRDKPRTHSFAGRRAADSAPMDDVIHSCCTSPPVSGRERAFCYRRGRGPDRMWRGHVVIPAEDDRRWVSTRRANPRRWERTWSQYYKEKRQTIGLFHYIFYVLNME